MLQEYGGLRGRSTSTGTRRLANLAAASMPDHEFVELVWENGRIAMRGGTPPSRCIVSRRSGDGKVACKAPDPGNHAKRPSPGDFYLRGVAHRNGVDSSARGNANDDNVAPADDKNRTGAADVASKRGDADRPVSSRNEPLFIRKFSHPTKTRDAGNHCPSQPPMQQGRDSAQFVGLGLCPIPHMSLGDHYDSSSDEMVLRESSSLSKPSNTNFSFFLRPPVVLRANNNRHATELPMRLPTDEDRPCAKTKTDKRAGAGDAREAPMTEPAAAFGRRTDLVDDKAKPMSTDEKTSEKAFPDEESQVLGGKDSSLRNRKSNDQYRDPSSTIAATAMDKTMPGEQRPCDPTPVASSSVCSREASNYLAGPLKRKHEDSESIYPGEDEDDEPEEVKRKAPTRRRTTIHNLSERRRRDRINKKMRALQKLLPNCDKVDKASVLDEVIEHLKTLQRQLQMMSTRSPLFMPPMMLPTGVHNMHVPQMSQFPLGMGMRAGAGADCSTFQLPIPPISGATALPWSTGAGIPMFGVQPIPYLPFMPNLTRPIPAVDVSGTTTAAEQGESADPSGNCDVIQNKEF
ncbi:hypothetical protein BT93_A1330 [Corymbia citriodora subsp. variegata]|nr:hypothetical protein BT93_A1330 [Corymbia citriodora subsp. variegata]